MDSTLGRVSTCVRRDALSPEPPEALATALAQQSVQSTDTSSEGKPVQINYKHARFIETCLPFGMNANIPTMPVVVSEASSAVESAFGDECTGKPRRLHEQQDQS